MIAIRSRVIVPMTQVPVEDGAVIVAKGKIIAVGSWENLRHFPAAEVFEFPDSAVVPGFINAHCHLDYTDFAGSIPPTKFFTDWIKTMLSVKATWSYSEYAQSWLRGAAMLLQSGCTAVADIEAVPELLPEVWSATPLRIFSFIEMTGIRSQRQPAQLLAEALEKIKELPVGRNTAHLSPHALYSTLPGLYGMASRVAEAEDLLMSTHLAESEQEFEMFMYKRGSLHDWLKKQREIEDVAETSPVRRLFALGGLNKRMIAVHVNYLWRGDAELLGQSGASVVHCPRSHAYFRHKSFPYEELTAQKVNICLGTDSLASVSKIKTQPMELNLFAEMQLFAANHPHILPGTILQMVTLNPATALRQTGRLGLLAEGACADLMVVPFEGKVTDVFEGILHFQGKPRACMVDGQWVYNRQQNLS